VSRGFTPEIYCWQNSQLHRWQPKLKLIGLGALILAFATVENWRLLPWMLLITAGLYYSANLPLSFLQKHLRYPGLLLLGVVAVLPFIAGETVIWQWGWFTLRQEGCLAMGLITARFFSIVTLSLLLLGTTPFVELVGAMRSLGLPPLLADITLLTYRYLSDIGINLRTMQTAMRLRGFNTRAQRRFLLPVGRDLRQLAALAGSLLVRSYEQSERVYQAMRLRGYSNTTKRVHQPLGESEHWHWVALVLVLSIAIAFIVAGFFLPPI
jgi:cobalt/nickel transport system permease protein